MSWDTFQQNITNFKQAIQVCFQQRYTLPALALLYSLIDHLAWIGMPEGQQDVTRQDFINWVEKYALPNSGLSCTAVDLYAARCGILHTHAAGSRLSSNSAAREVYYAWGKADMRNLEELNRIKTNAACAVRVEALFKAIIDGKQRFLKNIEKDPVLKARVVRRSAKLFAEVRD